MNSDSIPRISEPRKNTYVADDQAINALLDHLERHTFNPDEWEFHIPSENKYVTYEELREMIEARYPPLTTVEALKMSFIYLPQRLKMIKEELRSYFKRLTLNREEMAEYISQLEDQLEERKLREQELEEKASERARVIERLQSKNEGLLEALKAVRPSEANRTDKKPEAEEDAHKDKEKRESEEKSDKKIRRQF